MNILILNWRDIKNPKSGGAEIVTMEHARAWVSSGHSVTWFTSSFAGSKSHEIIDRVNFVRKGNFITVYLFGPIYYLINKKKFDFIVDEIHGLPFFTPLYTKKPKIAFIHEVADKIWDYMFPFPINKIGKIIEPLYFKIYKDVVFWVPSKSTRDDIIKYGIKKENCINITGAISNKVLANIPNDKESVPTFIFVSRVVKMKGIEDVIESFSYILKELKTAKLWIVGDGDIEYVNSLKKMIVKNLLEDKVKIFGKVSEQKKIELMRKAHILLHASVKEGWGLVVIEAASQGTPSIVYDVSGLRDSVLNNKTGIVIKDNSPKLMADESVSLLKDVERYKIFQKNGLKWARSLTWERATKQSLNLINNVFNKTNK